MNDINTFWHSQIVACVLGPDQPQWRNNAVSYGGTGYIYYDPAFLAQWASSGSALPPVLVLAHESGHEIQGRYNTRTGVSIRDELGADCFAGYFMAWLACNNRLSMSDVTSVFERVCTLNQDSPWWAPGSHGTCTDRAQAIRRGIQGFQTNTPPLNACTY